MNTQVSVNVTYFEVILIVTFCLTPIFGYLFLMRFAADRMFQNALNITGISSTLIWVALASREARAIRRRSGRGTFLGYARLAVTEAGLEFCTGFVRPGAVLRIPYASIIQAGLVYQVPGYALGPTIEVTWTDDAGTKVRLLFQLLRDSGIVQKPEASESLLAKLGKIQGA